MALSAAASRLGSAHCDAVANTRPQDRAGLLEWITGRGLLGLAQSGGFEAAAGVAYRMADTLAGAVH